MRERGAWNRLWTSIAVLACAGFFAVGCEDSLPVAVHGSNGRRVAPMAAQSDGGSSILDATMDSDADRGGSPIAIENRLPGTDEHQLNNAADSHQVEGYASAVSAGAGESIELFVNVNREQPVRWELYRHGYYQGHGARRVAVGGPALVAVQIACPVDSHTGLIECSWASAFSLEIEPTWLSGYYTFKLINEDGFEAEVPLIVRESARRAPLLMLATVNTWQAYNFWGGTSLYKNFLPAGSPFKGAKAMQVSFDRPYAAQNSLDPWIATVRWLEKKSYDVAYVTSGDIDSDSSVLADRKMFLSVGHDEYVSRAERDAVVAARDQGVSLGFVSGNGTYRRVTLEPSSRGVPRRIMTKGALFDAGKTPQPENALLGVNWANWSNFYGVPFVVVHANHWIYEGTGVKNFDTLANVVGPEWDTVSDDAASPADLEIVGDSPTITEAGAPSGHANATVYYPRPDSFVFAAGSVDWGFGLSDDPSHADARIQRMMENVLTRAGLPPSEPTLVEPLAPGLDVASPPPSEVIAGTGEAGSADGAASMASFDTPAGIAAGPNGELYVADVGNALVRKISSDGQVSTIAGCRADRPTQPECLALPIGIAVDAHGVVYVADAYTDLIRAIRQDGTLVTYAGTGSKGLVDAADPLQAAFQGPRGLAVGPSGELYVADTHNDAIRRVDAQGVTTLALNLHEVSAVAVDAKGVIYFSSIVDGQVGMLENGQLRVLANPTAVPGNREGPGVTARLNPMDGLWVEADRLVFSDTGNYRVRALALGENHEVSTLAGDGRAGLDTSVAPHLVLPRGLTPYKGGYAVADSGNHRILWVGNTRSSLQPAPNRP